MENEIGSVVFMCETEVLPCIEVAPKYTGVRESEAIDFGEGRE